MAATVFKHLRRKSYCRTGHAKHADERGAESGGKHSGPMPPCMGRQGCEYRRPWGVGPNETLRGGRVSGLKDSDDLKTCIVDSDVLCPRANGATVGMAPHTEQGLDAVVREEHDSRPHAHKVGLSMFKTAGSTQRRPCFVGLEGVPDRFQGCRNETVLYRNRRCCVMCKAVRSLQVSCVPSLFILY